MTNKPYKLRFHDYLRIVYCYDGKSRGHKLFDFLLTPYRVIFGRIDVSIKNNKPHLELGHLAFAGKQDERMSIDTYKKTFTPARLKQHFNQCDKHYQGLSWKIPLTLFTVVLWLPWMLLGIVAKAITLLSKNTQQRNSQFAQILGRGTRYEKFRERWCQFRQRVKQHDDWDKPKIKKQFQALFDESLVVANALLDHMEDGIKDAGVAFDNDSFTNFMNAADSKETYGHTDFHCCYPLYEMQVSWPSDLYSMYRNRSVYQLDTEKSEIFKKNFGMSCDWQFRFLKPQLSKNAVVYQVVPEPELEKKSSTPEKFYRTPTSEEYKTRVKYNNFVTSSLVNRCTSDGTFLATVTQKNVRILELCQIDEENNPLTREIGIKSA